MPIVDLPTSGLDKFQVEFDLLGPARVWIDDVQLCELSFDSVEQLQLNKMVSAAALQLRNGNIGACLTELDGYWMRFLTTYVPVQQQQIAGAPPPAAGGTAPAGANPAATKPVDKSASKRLLDLWK